MKRRSQRLKRKESSLNQLPKSLPPLPPTLPLSSDVSLLAQKHGATALDEDAHLAVDMYIKLAMGEALQYVAMDADARKSDTIEMCDLETARKINALKLLK